MRCGACCVLPDENRQEDVWAWVEVDEDATLLKRQHVVTRHVTRDEAGRLHLRLDDRGRCTALRGRLGESVRCEIYEVRPRGCRRVEAGDERCVQYRRERGIGRGVPTAPPPRARRD